MFALLMVQYILALMVKLLTDLPSHQSKLGINGKIIPSCYFLSIGFFLPIIVGWHQRCHQQHKCTSEQAKQDQLTASCMFNILMTYNTIHFHFLHKLGLCINQTTNLYSILTSVSTAVYNHKTKNKGMLHMNRNIAQFMFGSFYGQVLECHGDSLQQVAGRLELCLSLHTSFARMQLRIPIIETKSNSCNGFSLTCSNSTSHTMAFLGFIGAKRDGVPANHIGLH